MQTGSSFGREAVVGGLVALRLFRRTLDAVQDILGVPIKMLGFLKGLTYEDMDIGIDIDVDLWLFLYIGGVLKKGVRAPFKGVGVDTRHAFFMGPFLVTAARLELMLVRSVWLFLLIGGPFST